MQPFAFIYKSVDYCPGMFLKLFSRSKPPNDLELIQQYKETGDLALVGQLFERYTEMVYLVCVKYLKDEEESKDATMQIFENLIPALKKHEVTNFKSWLHVMAKNHCLLQLRGQKKHETAPLDEAVLPLVEKAGAHYPLEETDQELELQMLTKSLEQLSPEQRSCVELFYLEKKSYKEIAALTGLDVSKVKSHIQNGKRNLKIYMNKNYEQE
ncbi:sigma-70 family RNA polymerase sigma factor [Rufibacter soli]